MKYVIVLIILLASGTALAEITVQENGLGGWLMTMDNGKVMDVPNDPKNRHYQMIQDWIAAGNTPLQPPISPTPPTDAEIIDQTWQNNPLIRALILREAKGRGRTPQQILDELKAELP